MVLVWDSVSCYLMTDYGMCFSNKSLDINMQILLLFS